MPLQVHSHMVQWMTQKLPQQMKKKKYWHLTSSLSLHSEELTRTKKKLRMRLKVKVRLQKRRKTTTWGSGRRKLAWNLQGPKIK